MSWLKRTLNSSVGGKFLVSLTGLAMVGFIVGHLAGNLLIFVGPEALNAYAEGLRTFPALLWAARIGLIVTFVLHVVLAIKLNYHNRQARPEAYAAKSYRKASLTSRTMVLTGLLLLFYIVFHLLHFTLRSTSPEIAQFGPYDVYQMLVWSFQQPLNVITYLAGMVVLGMHLSHGISSMWQSMGINHPKYNAILRRMGPVLGVLLAAAYSSIPLAVQLGLLK